MSEEQIPTPEPSENDRKRLLQECESILERGRKNKSTFIEQGESLLKIRNERLYKLKGYNSFETYCNEEWGFTRQRASRLILAFKFENEKESTTVDTHSTKSPTTERDIREKRRQKQRELREQKSRQKQNEVSNPKPRSENEELFIKIEKWGMELNLFLRKLTEVGDQKSAYRKLDPIIDWLGMVEGL